MDNCYNHKTLPAVIPNHINKAATRHRVPVEKGLQDGRKPNPNSLLLAFSQVSQAQRQPLARDNPPLNPPPKISSTPEDLQRTPPKPKLPFEYSPDMMSPTQLLNPLCCIISSLACFGSTRSISAVCSVFISATSKGRRRPCL